MISLWTIITFKR